ncbi:hypothetical protein [Paraburkholderia adhaesiva]|uniref:hypothetical protein n=1 Tax=Paraburkholderia adhaesiva TaxID=2883244 RepID=UPI001F3BBE9E|nr:hypothetical protein [Paraburkholderia adhaesiva]
MTSVDVYDSLIVFAAGSVGALVRVMFVPPPTRMLKLAHLLCGSLMAVFIAPAIVEHWFRGESVFVQAGIAVLTGAVGPNLAELIIRLVQRRGDSVADQLVDRVTGRPENQKRDTEDQQ